MSYAIIDESGEIIEQSDSPPANRKLEKGHRFTFKDAFYHVPMARSGYFKITKTTYVNAKRTMTPSHYNVYITSTNLQDLNRWVHEVKNLFGWYEIEDKKASKLPTLASMKIQGKLNRVYWWLKWIWTGSEVPLNKT